jgi:phthalate 4,5-cis-dihydrodiol dehydrogenase
MVFATPILRAMTDRKLRLGAVGLGRAFSLMLPTFLLHTRIALVAGADPRAEARAAFLADTGGKAYATIEELCADRDVDAVYISTAHELHAAHACYAASQGKHLLVEKPMALTLADCAAITDAAKKAGVALVVGHSHSFDRPIARTRELIASGMFGPVRMINALNYTDWLYRPRRPEELADGGGVLFNQAPHQVDVVTLLAGRRVTRVRAQAGAWDKARPVPAAYSALLSFEDGAFASLTYSGFAHFDSDELMQWVGEGGQKKDPAAYGAARRALAGATREAEIDMRAARGYGRSPGAATAAVPQKHPHFGFLVISCEAADLHPLPDGVRIYGNDAVRFDPLPAPAVPRGEVMDELVAAVFDGKTPLHGGEWGYATIEVCLAMQTSAQEAREITLQRKIGAD